MDIDKIKALWNTATGEYFEAQRKVADVALYCLGQVTEGYPYLISDESDQDTSGSRTPTALVSADGTEVENDDLLDATWEFLCWLDDSNSEVWGVYAPIAEEELPWVVTFDLDKIRAEVQL